jgi:hypothetical protein
VEAEVPVTEEVAAEQEAIEIEDIKIINIHKGVQYVTT